MKSVTYALEKRVNLYPADFRFKDVFQIKKFHVQFNNNNIIICDTYKVLLRTHAVKALLAIRFSKKPSFQLPRLEGLIVLNWHFKMLW
jgi:hypothetical protein